MLNKQIDSLLKTNTRVRNNLKFELALIAVGVVLFFTYYFKFSQLTNVIALSTLVFYIIYMRVDYYNWTLSDQNEKIEFELNEIQSVMYKYVDENMNRIRFSENKNLVSKDFYKKNLERMTLTALYTDSKLIRFLYTLLFLYKFNEDSYAQMILATNNILEHREKLEEFYNENGYLPEGVYYYAEQAEQLKTKALNFAHTFIYAIPKSYDLENMTEKIIERFHELLKPHVIAIKKMSIKQNVQNGINRTTRFVNTEDHLAQPMDTDLQKHINSKYNKTYHKLEQQDRFELYI